MFYNVICLWRNSKYASVAQWIERCPPEAGAGVRLPSDAFLFIKNSVIISDDKEEPYVFRKRK